MDCVFLHGIKETAEHAIGVFKAILMIKEHIEQEVLPRFHQRRQESARQLIRHLYGKPVLDIKNMAEFLHTTSNTAGKLAADLVQYGVLKEITGQQRNRMFVFFDYLKLFTQD